MVRIVTDSGCMMNKAQGAEKGLTVIPLQVTIKNNTYEDLENMQSEEFVAMIKEKHVPTSSQPAIGLVSEALDNGEETIYITMADGLSGTYQSAITALDMCEHKDKIHVWNSRSLCGPQKNMVIKAAEMAQANKSAEEIIAALEVMAAGSYSYLMPSDFDFLKRGGRMTALAATMGGLLRINPVVTQTPDGRRLDKFAMSRTFKRGVEEILGDLKAKGIGANHKIIISHAFAQDKCDLVIEMVKEKFPECEQEIIPLSPAMITQGGPGCLAIQAFLKVD